MNRKSVPIFENRHVPNINFGLQLCKIPIAKAEPIVYPKYTTLPRKPNLVFSISNSVLILTDPAGRMPISMLTNKFAKN